MTTRPAYVALGSNLGEPAATLSLAARRMDGILPGVRLAARSRIWHTAPNELEAMGYPRPECLRSGDFQTGCNRTSPWYANMVVRLECGAGITPEALFESLMALEAELGRDRLMEKRFGPRFIDIDLLAFGDETRRSHRLTLPHPRMLSRPFVLLPLAEVAPELGVERILEGLSFTASGTMVF